MRRIALAITLLLPLAAAGLAGPPETGILTVRYETASGWPYAYVQVGETFLGRLYLGRTRDFRVRAGIPLAVRLYQRGDTVTRTVSVPAGGRAEVALTLVASAPDQGRTATIVVSYSHAAAWPTAEVLVNRVSRGALRRGQVREFTVPAGRCAVELRRDAASRMVSLELAPGARQQVSLTLAERD